MLASRVISENAGVDRADELEDGLHVYLCGTGSPLPDPDRAGPCLGVLAGNDAFIFDAGSGSVRKLLRMDFPADKLRAIFLTHLHSDHIDGLGEMLLQVWMAGGRSEPIPVYGPLGTEDVIAGLMQAYGPDKAMRIAHHGPQVALPGGFGAAAHILPAPLDVAPVWTAGRVRIAAIKVNHPPVVDAFGYRVDYRGRAVSISGDTTATPVFTGASRGVDVMLHEALSPWMVGELGKSFTAHGRSNPAQIMRDIPGYHSSPEDAAKAAQGAGARALVLYHLIPGPPNRYLDEAFLADAPRQFDGPITVGRDGDIISLPGASKQIRWRERW
jgi:ribonuclease Z